MNQSDTLKIELVTPESVFYSDTANSVVVPGSEGQLGILPRHIPLISSLKGGLLITEGRKQGDEEIYVAGGFVEVTGDSCIVIAEEAIRVQDINVDEAQRRYDDANFIIEKSDVESEVALARKEKSIAQDLLHFAGQAVA